MPLNNLILPNLSADLVAVYDEDFNQVFSEARPIKASYNRASKVMTHPLEDGSTIADHRIILPVRIELSLIVQSNDYRSVYGQIEDLFNRAAILSVQGKAKTFSNLIITDPVHEEDPSLFNTIAIALKLEEVNIIQPRYGSLPSNKVKNKANSDTVDRGQIQGQSSNRSILHGWFL